MTVNPPIRPDPRLLHAVAKDAGIRRAHARVLRLMEQVRAAQPDTPQFTAAAQALTEACQERARLFDLWAARQSPAGNGL